MENMNKSTICFVRIVKKTPPEIRQMWLKNIFL